MLPGKWPLLPALLGFVLGVCLAQSSSLTGTWILNVEKSQWGKMRRPHSVVVNIEHNEPVLRYLGAVVDVTGEASRDFGFDGAIDGREYPLRRSYGEGKVTLTRRDANTVVSVFRSDDGRFVERTTSTISADGRTMTRKMDLRAPDGRYRWTEIYEKR